jgi:hypothetical protein
MPFLDKNILDKHHQIYQYSCIPSCVEIILKLCGYVTAQYYEQQISWGNRNNGSFADYHENNIEGLIFHHAYNFQRSDDFPLEELFGTIQEEIEDGRFVAVSLDVTIGWHMYIIYEIDTRGEYLAVSKRGKETIFEDSVKKIVTRMKGTDILIYKA